MFAVNLSVCHHGVCVCVFVQVADQSQFDAFAALSLDEVRISVKPLLMYAYIITMEIMKKCVIVVT